MILLTGASGFIAKHVALKLLAAGHSLRGTVRRLDRAEGVRRALAPHLPPEALARLSFVQADLELEAGWAQAMAGVGVLVHTASPFPLAQPKDEMELIRPARDGTLRVLRAAQAAGVRRVVLTSSVAAILSDDRERISDEGDWCNTDLPTTTAYAKSKTLAERAAWEFCDAQCLALTTINPGFVLGAPLDGEYGSSIALVRRILKGRDPMLPLMGFPVVDVQDVAEMHLRAVEAPETAGKRFIAANGSLSMLQMGRLLKAAYPTRRIPTRQAPALLLRLMALADLAVRGILPKLGRVEQVSNQRAVEEMEMVFTAPGAALLGSAEWLVSQGQVWA